jgi:hypothetical protein
MGVVSVSFNFSVSLILMGFVVVECNGVNDQFFYFFKIMEIIGFKIVLIDNK